METEKQYGLKDFLGVSEEDIQPGKLFDLPADKITALMYWNMIAPATDDLEEIEKEE